MSAEHRPHPGLGRAEFVGLVAAIISVNALAVDLMVPALSDIGEDLGAPTANAKQWVITAFVFGFGFGQILYGPLADRYGRRPVLLVTLAGFVAASMFAADARTFAMLIAARVVQGLMSASSRVLAVAIIRDNYSGRDMARISSLAQMIYFLVPILAPSAGQMLLDLGSWRFIFYVLGGLGVILWAWLISRLPETLPRPMRRSICYTSLASAYCETLTNRYSLGYAIAASLVLGGSIGFISTSQQIFSDTFHQASHFPILFATCAFFMGCASIANSLLVGRVGTRFISQSGLVALIALSLGFLLISWADMQTLWSYVTYQALSMACIGLCGANFGAMAMQPVGHIAGTASSIQGFIMSIGAVAVGSAIGQAYDGTTLPLVIGYLCIGISALFTVLAVEGGRLFRVHLA